MNKQERDIFVRLSGADLSHSFGDLSSHLSIARDPCSLWFGHEELAGLRILLDLNP